MLSDHEEFVRSDGALRVAMLCRSSGRPFPVFSPDEVVQFCIEEACFERLELTEQAAKSSRMAEMQEEQAAAAAMDAALAPAREFARTGVPQ